MWQCHSKFSLCVAQSELKVAFGLNINTFALILWCFILSCWNLPLHYKFSTLMRSINAMRFLQINQHADVVIRSYPPYLLYENKQIQKASTAGFLFCWELVFRDKQMLRTERMHHKTKNKWKSIWLIVFWAHTHWKVS